MAAIQYFPMEAYAARIVALRGKKQQQEAPQELVASGDEDLQRLWPSFPANMLANCRKASLCCARSSKFGAIFGLKWHKLATFKRAQNLRKKSLMVAVKFGANMAEKRLCCCNSTNGMLQKIFVRYQALRDKHKHNIMLLIKLLLTNPFGLHRSCIMNFGGFSPLPWAEAHEKAQKAAAEAAANPRLVRRKAIEEALKQSGQLMRALHEVYDSLSDDVDEALRHNDFLAYMMRNRLEPVCASSTEVQVPRTFRDKHDVDIGLILEQVPAKHLEHVLDDAAFFEVIEGLRADFDAVCEESSLPPNRPVIRPVSLGGDAYFDPWSKPITQKYVQEAWANLYADRRRELLRKKQFEDQVAGQTWIDTTTPSQNPECANGHKDWAYVSPSGAVVSQNIFCPKCKVTGSSVAKKLAATSKLPICVPDFPPECLDGHKDWATVTETGSIRIQRSACTYCGQTGNSVAEKLRQQQAANSGASASRQDLDALLTQPQDRESKIAAILTQANNDRDIAEFLVDSSLEHIVTDGKIRARLKYLLVHYK